jgi:uncharacterized protein (DUF58 family)
MKKHRHMTYYELTFAGFVFVGVACFVLIAALNSQNNILFWALGIVLGTLLVSGALGDLLLRRLEIRRSVGECAVAGEPMEVHYRLVNHKKLWPSCAVRITEARFLGAVSVIPEGYCLHLGPGQTTLVMSHLVPTHRGVIELREQRVCCSFPFGFLNRAIHVRSVRRIVVFPRIGMLNRELLARSRTFASGGSTSTPRRGGSDEFFGLREYQSGDSIRSIHWRRSAHTGQLMVKEMTTDTPPTIVVTLDLRQWAAVTNGPALAERAIELAAAWICRGLMDHFSVGIQICGYSVPAPTLITAGRSQRQILLESLATIDLAAIKPENDIASPPPQERASRKAEYIVISLSEKTAVLDMVPAGCNYTLLCMDNRDSQYWLYFPSQPGPSAAMATFTAQADIAP